MARVVASSRLEVRREKKKSFEERERAGVESRSFFFPVERSHFRLEPSEKEFSTGKKFIDGVASAFLSFSANHAARSSDDDARRQRRAGLVLLLLVGEARAPSPQRRPATTLSFLVAAHRPRRQRYRGGVQGRRRRHGRLHRQHWRLLLAGQVGRWTNGGAEKERRMGKSDALEHLDRQALNYPKRAPFWRAFRVAGAGFFSLRAKSAS